MDKDKPPIANGTRHILCISRVGCIGDLCRQLTAEGNHVKYFIESKHDKDVSDGFVEKVDDWKTVKDWACLLYTSRCV